jgi:hypothetical protein
MKYLLIAIAAALGSCTTWSMDTNVAVGPDGVAVSPTVTATGEGGTVTVRP